MHSRYGTLLYRNLDKIDPLVNGQKGRIREDLGHFLQVTEYRDDDRDIQHLKFLFDGYEPEYCK